MMFRQFQSEDPCHFEYNLFFVSHHNDMSISIYGGNLFGWGESADRMYANSFRLDIQYE